MGSVTSFIDHCFYPELWTKKHPTRQHCRACCALLAMRTGAGIYIFKCGLPHLENIISEDFFKHERNDRNSNAAVWKNLYSTQIRQMVYSESADWSELRKTSSTNIHFWLHYGNWTNCYIVSVSLEKLLVLWMWRKQFWSHHSNVLYFGSLHAPSALLWFQKYWDRRDSGKKEKTPTKKSLCGEVSSKKCVTSTTKVICSASVPASRYVHVFTMLSGHRFVYLRDPSAVHFMEQTIDIPAQPVSCESISVSWDWCLSCLYKANNQCIITSGNDLLCDLGLFRRAGIWVSLWFSVYKAKL